MSRSDEDDDEAPRRRETRPARPRPAKGFSHILRIVSLVVWGGIFAGALLGGCGFVVGLSSANGAPQEAAVGAMASAFFIGIYIAARAVEKLSNTIERMLAERSTKRD